jgi:hypothetical protein
LSYNQVTQHWEPKPVLETFRTQYNGDIVAIQIDKETINATGGHPFWVLEGEELENRPLCDCLPSTEQNITPQGRWVYARDLCVGDVICSRSLGTQKISALNISLTETLVYNFLVDDLHNYAVGIDEILVHNTNAPEKISYMKRKPGLSGKEAATDIPSFARGKPPLVGETPTQYAERLLVERYGKNWRTIFKEQGKKIVGADSEFNKIEKSWRGYIKPE